MRGTGPNGRVQVSEGLSVRVAEQETVVGIPPVAADEPADAGVPAATAAVDVENRDATVRVLHKEEVCIAVGTQTDVLAVFLPVDQLLDGLEREGVPLFLERLSEQVERGARPDLQRRGGHLAE